MTEQAVKDAKARRDAAQADLDKAVDETRGEIERAADAVKDAAPDKAVHVVPVNPPKPVTPPKPVETFPHVVAPKVEAAPEQKDTKTVVVVLIAIAVIVLALMHFGFKVF